jgi:hypothetical protein
MAHVEYVSKSFAFNEVDTNHWNPTLNSYTFEFGPDTSTFPDPHTIFLYIAGLHAMRE